MLVQIFWRPPDCARALFSVEFVDVLRRFWFCMSSICGESGKCFMKCADCAYANFQVIVMTGLWGPSEFAYAQFVVMIANIVTRPDCFDSCLNFS